MKNQKGFTLIELLMVVAIIGIVAAIAIPTAMHYQLEANCKNFFGYPHSAVTNPVTKPLVQKAFEERRAALREQSWITQKAIYQIRSTAVVPEEAQAKLTQVASLEDHDRLVLRYRSKMDAFAKEVGLTVSD